MSAPNNKYIVGCFLCDSRLQMYNNGTGNLFTCKTCDQYVYGGLVCSNIDQYQILALRSALKFYHAPQDLDQMVIHLIAL